MSVFSTALRKGAIAAGCLLLALQVDLAQNSTANAQAGSQDNSQAKAQHRAAAQSAQATREILIQKAHALESRGRPDMAIQLWQQVLLSDPNNLEALAGMARDLKLTGSDQAPEALDRLRKVNPNDPNISKIEGLSSTRAETNDLRQAGELASQGKIDDAMQIYRRLYGDRPPDGDIALAYYQTLYGTANGKQEAVTAMRALAARNPGDPRFSLELAIMLTYDEKTRAEGIRLLKEHPTDASAQAALRQALIWDSGNPASAAELRAYLKDHPQDTELSGHLKEDETRLAQMNSGIARTPDERAAFAALNAHRLEEAEKRFTDLLARDPNNGRLAAGMGFLRMQQSNFGGAISYLAQAEVNGYKARAVEDALATARFWSVMGEAAQALDENRLADAEAKYRAALAMRPRSPEAFNGLAGLLTKEQKYSEAAAVYEQLIKIQPASNEGWRGLFLSCARDNQNQKALAVQARFPGPVKAALGTDPEYLRTLATIYKAEDRIADEQRVLAQAMALPFPDNGATLKTDTKLEYAAILVEAKRYDQAAALYGQVLTDDVTNLQAWMGIVNAHHAMGQDAQAIDDVQKMPPATYEAALTDSGFLSMLGGIYQQANQLDVAQGLLERSVNAQIAAGKQPSIALQLQLASVYLERNNTEQAYQIYHRVLSANADRVDAWKGLIGALQATHRENEALQEIAQIAARVRKQLENDIEFVQTEASLYASAGDAARALEYMNRVEAYYAKLHSEAPADIEIQNSWLLFNTHNDRMLYPSLMRLGGRGDLTIPQRETVQDIWATWSVRRAAAAMENGNTQRAVDILDAASQAFPDNLTVRKAVAGGYAQVGRAKESLMLFKSVPMQDASAGDFEGAIGAALAANDKSQAEQWLRQALERFPHEPSILSLAARYEQARGDNQRAAEYYRASLAAMPSTTPAQKLAHVLVYPDQDTRAHRTVTAADLQQLLDPDYEPFPKTTKLPPLPAYGVDPYNGAGLVNGSGLVKEAGPVVLSPDHSSADQPPGGEDLPLPKPPSSDSAAPSNPVYTPQALTKYWTRSLTKFPAQDARQTWQHSSSKQASNRAGAVWHFANQDGASRIWPSDKLRLISATFQIDRKARLHWNNSAGNHGYFHAASFGSSARARTLTRFHAVQHATVEVQQGTLGQAPRQSANPAVQLSADAPRSPASDAWKGLISSLMAAHRNAEAHDEIAKIPADVRAQLEADVEFEQMEASLYASAGDSARATQYLNRVASYYLLHRTPAPAGLEVQHAWMLYNVGDEQALYPVLRSLDARADLNAAEREQVQTIWATWAVRRAESLMNNGATLRGVQLLQAAAQDYPGNMDIRKAVARAYAQTGHPADALALFKTFPMQDASSGDYQGAINAALGATDMAQAELWLRQALSRFPADPQILTLAARFEQARGNTARAADFWRASLAAMPPGSSAARLDAGLVSHESYAPPGPGEMKRLMDPGNGPSSKTQPLPPLPAYSNAANPPVSGAAAPSANTSQQRLPQIETQSGPWTRAPSANPLPLPGERSPASIPTETGNTPVYLPQSAATVPQSVAANQPRAAARPVQPNRPTAKPSSSSNTSPYMGRMNLPPSEETVDSTVPASSGDGAQTSIASPSLTPRPRTSSPNPSPGLRISSQPMGPVAAQAQALFADQTDGQLTQGSASAIHNLPNNPVGPLPGLKGRSATNGQYNVAQYTPSAQEAATGAYSAPKQQGTPQTNTASPLRSNTTAPPQCVPVQCTAAPVKPAAKKKKRNPAVPAGTPTLDQIPQQQGSEAAPVSQPGSQSGSQQAPQTVQAPVAVPPTVPAPTTNSGLSDEELQERNLPPLRGPWIRLQRNGNPINPRDEAEMQLRSIESGYSPWVAGTGLINYRTGNLGYDHLSALEAPFELSIPVGYNARLTVVAKPVFLDSGQADGTSTLTVQQQTTSGTSLVVIPQPIGTATNTALAPPAQQNAVGVGGELQLAFPHLALAAGYSPAGFLVATITGRAMWKPGNGPITLNFSRDPVRDTQLSYAGLRDPSGDTLGNQGQIWGGVVANQGQVQFSHGDAESGFYIGGGGQYLTGYHVEDNNRFDGLAGAYWRLKTLPEYGNLSIGVNFFGLHYAHNEDAFTHGMGGYFSPQAYLLANVPFTWAAHYGTRWHYNVLGSLGVQAFQQDTTPLWPLAVDEALEISLNNAMLPAKTSVGPNYDVRSQASYQIGPHWFAGGFFNANNSRNYTSVSAGFSIHYMFRAQPSTATTPTGIFPTDGLRPFAVP